MITRVGEAGQEEQQVYSPTAGAGEGVLSGAAWALAMSATSETGGVTEMTSNWVSEVTVDAWDAWDARDPGRRLRGGAAGRSSIPSSNSMASEAAVAQGQQ